MDEGVCAAIAGGCVSLYRAGSRRCLGGSSRCVFTSRQRQRGARGGPVVPAAVFVSGYLAVWLLAGLGADLAYTVAHALGARVPFGPEVAPYLGGAILVLAGLYQFTPLKNVCLTHSRSPLHVVMHGWRDGRGGAVRMGATHGLFCLGCCWGIMAVLFVVGLMNLGWMAALSLVIVAEKLAPRGVAIGRVVGGLFVALGVLMALRPGLFPAAGLASRVFPAGFYAYMTTSTADRSDAATWGSRQPPPPQVPACERRTACTFSSDIRTHVYKRFLDDPCRRPPHPCQDRRGDAGRHDGERHADGRDAAPPAAARGRPRHGHGGDRCTCDHARAGTDYSDGHAATRRAYMT